jgi:hypothetical protein
MIKAIVRSSNEVFNINNHSMTTLGKIFLLLSKITNKKLINHVSKTKGSPEIIKISNKKIREITKYKISTNIKQGLLKTIKSIIINCESEDPVINPGEKQCQYCKLKQHLKCPALKNELATIDKTINLPELSNEDLTKLYLRANIVDKYLNAIKEEFKNRIEEVGNCGGYIMKEYEVKEYLVKAGKRKKIVKEKK